MKLLISSFIKAKSILKKPTYLWVLIIIWLIPIKPSTAQNKIDSLLNKIGQPQEDTTLIKNIIKLSLEYHKKDDHKNDISYASTAVEKALTSNSKLFHARALNNLGLIYRYHQQYAGAVPLHKKAFELIENENVPSLDKMIFANNTGVAARYNTDLNTAVYYYLKSLSIAESEKNLKNIEIASNGLGNTLLGIPNRQEEALSYLERALSIAKATNNTLGMAMNYLTISDYYSNKGQYATSRKYLNDLLQVNNDREDKFGMAMTYQSMGKNYLSENKDLKTAQSYFEKSLHLFEELNDPLKQAHVFHNLGQIHLLEKKLGNALKNFNNSLDISKPLRNKRLIMKNNEMISLIYEELANPAKALAYYKTAQQYKDSINLSKQETEIAAINNRYNFEKKETEIELLIKDKSLQESQLIINKAKLKNRGLTIFFMALSLLSLLLLVLIQQKNRRSKLKSKQKLQEQEREKTQAVYEKNLMEAEMLATRMQVNPHFLFNCLNSIKYLIQSNQNTKATKYLVIFSRFVRMVLETSQKPVSTIEEEIELTTYYLKLEENRFNDDFSFHIENNLDKKKIDTQLPTLLLQPFVENAIWHGLLPSEKETKKVSVSFSNHPQGIQISIDDNGIGRNKTKINNHSYKSMGNKIAYDRIQLFNKSYSDTIEWTTIDKTDDNGNSLGTRVEIVILKTKNNKIVEESILEDH